MRWMTHFPRMSKGRSLCRMLWACQFKISMRQILVLVHKVMVQQTNLKPSTKALTIWTYPSCQSIHHISKPNVFSVSLSPLRPASPGCVIPRCCGCGQFPGIWWKDTGLTTLYLISRSLETVAYYAQPNVTISSWAQCLEDDAKEFVRRNYTETPAGEIYYFQEMFMVPFLNF